MIRNSSGSVPLMGLVRLATFLYFLVMYAGARGVSFGERRDTVRDTARDGDEDDMRSVLEWAFSDWAAGHSSGCRAGAK
jgi:hypothetical protein